MAQLIDWEFLSARLLHRENCSSKRDYGHLYLVSGCGLVTLHTSACAAQICAVSNPSAILSVDPQSCFSCFEKDMNRYKTVAAGPGLGRHRRTATPATDAAQSTGWNVTAAGN